MQQGKPTNVEETNDGKSVTQGQGPTSTEQKETNGHQVEDKE